MYYLLAQLERSLSGSFRYPVTTGSISYTLIQARYKENGETNGSLKVMC